MVDCVSLVPNSLIGKYETDEYERELPHRYLFGPGARDQAAIERWKNTVAQVAPNIEIIDHTLSLGIAQCLACLPAQNLKFVPPVFSRTVLVDRSWGGGGLTLHVG